MNQSQSMNNPVKDVCSHCGSKEALRADSLLCVSISQWKKIKDEDKYKDKPPLDLITTFDNFVCWPIHLCGNCITTAFKYYLESTKRQASKSLIVTIVSLLFTGLFGLFGASMYVFPSWLSNNLAQAISTKIKGIYILPVTIGSFVIFVNFLRKFPKEISDYKKQLTELEKLGQLPATSGITAEHISKSFLWEAERIKTTLEHKKRSVNIYGDYSLPKHRKKEELPAWLRESVATEKSGLYEIKQNRCWEIYKSIDHVHAFDKSADHVRGFEKMALLAMSSGNKTEFVVCWEKV